MCASKLKRARTRKRKRTSERKRKRNRNRKRGREGRCRKDGNVLAEGVQRRQQETKTEGLSKKWHLLSWTDTAELCKMMFHSKPA